MRCASDRNGGAVVESLLQALAVSRTFHAATDVRAVREVSLSVGSGEVVALMGPSGSGKTTLLALLGGVDPPDTGEVRLHGVSYEDRTAAELRTIHRDAIGIVFQAHALSPTLSALENVELPLRIRRTEPREARERAVAWLERFDLGHRRDHRTYELSGGQQQRVAVARALVGEPEIVLADEPTSEVDVEGAELILEAFREVAGRGGSVIAATHDPTALRYASRAVLVRDGAIEASGPPQEMAARITTD
jgi:putative ABC transport system ATP-binding protein